MRWKARRTARRRRDGSSEPAALARKTPRRSFERRSQVALDVGDPAGLAVEELLHDGVPPAELLDREERRRLRVALCVDEGGQDRAVPLLGKDLLGRLRSDVVDE